MKNTPPFPAGTRLKGLNDFYLAIGQTAVILFTSIDCPFCVRFRPLFNNVVQNNPNLPIYFVDTDLSSEIVNIASIRGIPNVRLYRDGIHQMTLGNFSESDFKKFINYVI